MYMIFNVEHIHYLLNEPNMWNFAYNSDRMVYTSKEMVKFLHASVGPQ